MQIAIIEDELFIAEMLKELLQDLGHEVKWIANNYERAKTKIEQYEVDLYFLDINLGSGPSGFEVAKFIKETINKPFIFLTSYSDKETITVAMQYQPEAYLCKPFSEPDLFATISLIQARQGVKNLKEYFSLKDGVQQIKIPFNDILYIKSNNIYVEIVTVQKVHLVRTSLQKIVEEMNCNTMVKIHRTYAVNLTHVKSINSESVIIGDEKLPISRLHKDLLIEKFRTQM